MLSTAFPRVIGCLGKTKTDGESKSNLSLKVFWPRHLKYSFVVVVISIVVVLMLPLAYCLASNVCIDQGEKNQEDSWSGRRELEYLSPKQSFISSLNDCMFIALPEAQDKVFSTSDELIKLNAVTPLLFGSVTSLPASCLISASNFALRPTFRQFLLHNLAAPSYSSSPFLSNARMPCLKFLFRPLLVYGVSQIPHRVCSSFASDTISFCWALGF